MATQVAPPDYQKEQSRPNLGSDDERRVASSDARRQSERAIREVYDSLQSLMDWDYHYWLQRGSFEVEIGDIEVAENFLEHASGPSRQTTIVSRPSGRT